MKQPTSYNTHVFSNSSITCYGIEIVKRRLTDLGFDVNDKNGAILTSLYWLENIYELIKYRRKKSLVDTNIIAGGNFATCNPNTVLPFVSAIFAGDGELWDGNIDHDSIGCYGKKAEIALTKQIIPIHYEDIQQTRRTFIEMSRGCKNKCSFCQYGWLKPYRETDITDVKVLVSQAKTKSIRLFAADRFQHSKYPRLRQIMSNAGKNDTGSDVSLKFMTANKDFYPITRKLRTGIEGMSYRLRRLCGKDITDDEICEFIVDANKNNIGTIDWYMIYGLPTESKNDWHDYNKLMGLIADNIVKPTNICIHWNFFTPSSMTPFQWMPVRADYNHDEFARYIHNVDFRDRGLTIYHKPLKTSRHTIVKRTLAIRASKKSAKLVYNMAVKEPLFVKHPNLADKYFVEMEGRSMFDGYDYDEKLPWDQFVSYKKDRLKRVCKKRLEGYSE